MRAAPPTESEAAFFHGVSAMVPEAQDWYHADADGSLWMTVSYDDMIDGSMASTWRVDFDGLELVGGESPAYLNWDDGVRARATGMSLEPPRGFVVTVASTEQAVQVAANWLIQVTHGRAAR